MRIQDNKDNIYFKNPNDTYVKGGSCSWANYYDKKQVEVRSFLEQSDYSSYDKKDKNDNIIKVGTEEDAVSHLQNIESRRLIVENSLNEKNEQNTTTNDNVDYVGNKVPFKQH